MATSDSIVANSLIGVAGLVSNLGEICTHRACYLVGRSGAAGARLVVPDSPLRRKRDAPTRRIIPPTVVGLLLLSKSRPGRTPNSQGNTAIKIAATTNVPCAGCSCVPSRPGWASFMRALGLLSGVLVLVTDGYGPLIELGIWCLSATATSVRRVWRSPFWCPHHSSAMRVASARVAPMNTLSMTVSLLRSQHPINGCTANVQPLRDLSGTQPLAIHLEEVKGARTATALLRCERMSSNTAKPPSPQTIASPSTTQHLTGKASIASAMSGKRSAKL